MRFHASSGLISYGNLEFRGSEEHPIVLTGYNQSLPGKEETWQGLAVMNVAERSELSFAKILNTTGINQNDWHLTSGSTFYKSDVSLNNCVLVGNKCEDTVNIIRSKFFFDNVLIKNCASDALDSDFSNGEVVNSVFQDIGLSGGGDGIDLSGSNVVVKRCQFMNINDKAISVGERSFLHAEEIEIESAGSGVVSKDGSSVTVREASIKDSRVASLMTYIKKPEYGFSKLTAENISIVGKQRNASNTWITDLVWHRASTPTASGRGRGTPEWGHRGHHLDRPRLGQQAHVDLRDRRRRPLRRRSAPRRRLHRDRHRCVRARWFRGHPRSRRRRRRHHHAHPRARRRAPRRRLRLSHRGRSGDHEVPHGRFPRGRGEHLDGPRRQRGARHRGGTGDGHRRAPCGHRPPRDRRPVEECGKRRSARSRAC